MRRGFYTTALGRSHLPLHRSSLSRLVMVLGVLVDIQQVLGHQSRREIDSLGTDTQRTIAEPGRPFLATRQFCNSPETVCGITKPSGAPWKSQAVEEKTSRRRAAVMHLSTAPPGMRQQNGRGMQLGLDANNTGWARRMKVTFLPRGFCPSSRCILYCKASNCIMHDSLEEHLQADTASDEVLPGS